MENLKQRILIMAALSGTILCANISSAHAEDRLTIKEMQKIQGQHTGTWKIGQWCGAIGPSPCIAVSPDPTFGCYEVQVYPYLVCIDNTDSGQPVICNDGFTYICCVTGNWRVNFVGTNRYCSKTSFTIKSQITRNGCDKDINA